MSTANVHTRKRSIFINRNFLMLWIGGTISRLSWILIIIGFGMWIISGIVKNPAMSTGSVKGLEGAGFLGLLTFGVFAGVFIDRWKNKKRVLVVTSAARACITFLPIAAALLLSFTTTPAPWMIAFALSSIYLYILIVSVLTHFAIPASYTIFTDCVEEQDYAYANGLLLTATFASIPVGLAVALPLFSTLGIFGILVLCTLLYVISFLASNSLQVEIHNETSQRRGMFREWWESIAFCLKNPLLTTLLFALVLINIWNGAFTTLGNTFLTQNLHMAPEQPLYNGVDTLYASVSITIQIGFAVGALLAGLFARRMGEKRVFSYTLFAAGLLMIVVSRLTQYTPSMIAIFLVSFLLGTVNVIAVPIYLWVTPRHFLGRVRSIVDVTTNLAPMVIGAICLALLGSGVRNFHTQLYGMSFAFVDIAFVVAGILCTVGGIVVVRYLNSARSDEFKKVDVLPGTSTSGDLSASTVEMREPTASGRR